MKSEGINVKEKEKNRNNIEYNGGSIDGGDMPLLNAGNNVKTLIFKKEFVKFNFDGFYKAKNYKKVILENNIEIENGKSKTDIILTGEFKWTQETLEEEMKNGTSFIIKSDKFSIRYIRDGERIKKPADIISKIECNVETNEIAKKELEYLFENEKIMDYPKPTSLIRYLLSFFNDKESLILDFFSGSATTAHAVMQLNSEDKGNRKYIMVQLQENLEENLERALQEKEKETIRRAIKFLKKINKPLLLSEIGKERIRRAGEKIKQEIEEYNSNLKLGEDPKKVPDIGFKVFKVDDTNIKWYDLENFNEESQYSFDDPDSLDFVLGSNDIDIVYEIILRQNDVPLSENLEVLTDIGNRTYLYASTYLICLETEITEEMVEKLASLDPLPIKFVFRDSAFKDNISLKDETFRKLRSLIERNSGESKVSYRVEFI